MRLQHGGEALYRELLQATTQTQSCPVFVRGAILARQPAKVGAKFPYVGLRLAHASIATRGGSTAVSLYWGGGDQSSNEKNGCCQSE